MKDFNERFEKRLLEAKKRNKEYGFFFAYDEVISRWGLSKEERKQLIMPFLEKELERKETDKKKRGFINEAYSFLRIREEFNEILVKLIDIKFEEVINVYKDKKYGIFLALNNLDKSIREINGDKNFKAYEKKSKIKEELSREFQGKSDIEIKQFINEEFIKGLAETLNPDLRESLIEVLNEILIDHVFEESLKECKELDPHSAIFLALFNLSKKIKEIAGEKDYKLYEKAKIKEEISKEFESKKDESQEKELINQIQIFKNSEIYKEFARVLIDLKFENYSSEIKQAVEWGIFDAFNKLDNPNTGIIKEVTGEENYKDYDKKAKIESELSKELETKTNQEKESLINKGLHICAGNLEVLKSLMENHKADVLYKEAGAPFFFKSATIPQCLEVLDYLAQKNGNELFKEKDEEGNNILFSIVNDHNPQNRNLSQIAKFLIKNQVDPFEKNFEGISPYDRAKEIGQNDFLYLFKTLNFTKKEVKDLNYLDLALPRKKVFRKNI